MSDPNPNPTLPPDDPKGDVRLSAEDAAAVDRWLEARASGEADAAAETPDERELAIRRLLGLLDAGLPERSEDDDEELISRTLRRVADERDAEARPVAVAELCEDDGRALDAVLAAGGAVGPVPAGLSERAGKVRDVLSVLDRLPTASAELDGQTHTDEAMIQRTLDAVAAQRQRERFAQQVAVLGEPRRTLGVSWRQLASTAAILLIAGSLLLPMLDRQRQQAQQMACASNLGIAGQQIGSYTVDNAGFLPRGPVGDSWLQVGQPDAVDEAGRYRSNSAHLYLLIREGYVAPSRLACASNDEAATGLPGSGQMDWASPQAISYSYQNQLGEPIRVDRSRTTLAVLADKSPLFEAKGGRMVFDADAARDARTRLHRGKAQNILALDGRVRWSAEPVLDGDNIWQIRGHSGRYVGYEAPQDARRDSFLVP